MLSLALLACDKNEIEQDVALNENHNKALDARLRTMYGEWNWHSFPPQAFYTPWTCFWPSGNCLPTVTIRGRTASEDLELFIRHVENGTYSSFFSGKEYKRTFGIIDNFPSFHDLLVSDRLLFKAQTSDSLDRHLYVMGFDSESEFGNKDALIVFEIDVE